MPWTNPSEVATLTVNGTNYTDWTAVTVTEDVMEFPQDALARGAQTWSVFVEPAQFADPATVPPAAPSPGC